MNRDFCLPKTHYPEFCPGSGEKCKRRDCGIAYNWGNIFLSVPFGSWYKDRKAKLKEILEQNRFTPIFGDRSYRAGMMSEETTRRMCECAHAIIDISGGTDQKPAGGVLEESDFLRSTMHGDNVLLVAEEGSQVSGQLDKVLRKPYQDEGEFEEAVTTWIRHLDDIYTKNIQHLLFNNRSSVRDYEIWLHCLEPKHENELWEREQSDWDCKNPVSGGLSGCSLLSKAFEAFSQSEEHSITSKNICKTEKEPPFVKIPPYDEVRPHLQRSNLYLFDAPIARLKLAENNGLRYEIWPLNWIAQETIELLRNKLFPPLTIRMEIMNPQKNSFDSEVVAKYPEEQKKLKYDAAQPLVASKNYDYGFVLRAPNPYNQEGIVLIMAGLHAPATHVAAEVFSIPERIQQFRIDIRSQWDVDISKVEFFEAVFKINRSYNRDELGKIEWLHFREIL